MIVFFFGDSLTLGYGDETGLGWPGRITASLAKNGKDITGYNLGVRKDTTIRLQDRWLSEAAPRTIDGMESRFVFSFGVADIMNDVPLQESLKAARNILSTAQAKGDVLFIGPPPVSDTHKNTRVKSLAVEIARLCDELAIPAISTFDSMESSAVYEQALSDGDTVHPTAAGYIALADSILKHKAARTFFGLE
ncbi:hypothetical protein SYK_32380 [Pseudodesulfovibrio nedwellii]|uniref:SGNH hydrolase-type esterase domain-containing protein n=1 Tax=Pseudodesulfovibrio nedwellii TaxID=2973072 RepID=A0ABN6S8Z7_9BACT|nr:GDSL-type esterase/lipase family protein [Pseudodesulfovibrio nedwellii]BDQ38878.1 hypothetical protein SYK_32380 [Pseudodesulfovibrio nedwellii]